MVTYTHTFPLGEMISPQDTGWDFYPYNEYPLNEICFFDIETTGLSADVASIYLIGAGYYEGDSFKVVQWFADDYHSEKGILENFMNFVKSYKVLMHYNGNMFDIPFVRKKCGLYNADASPLENIKSVDLYVSLRKYAPLLKLPDKKLKSFEKFIGVGRDDEYDGGRLISVYSEYTRSLITGRENKALLNLLLLHNYEDITGLSQVASLLFLTDLGGLRVKADGVSLADGGKWLNIAYECSLCGDYSFDFELPVAGSDKSIKLSFSKSRTEVSVPVFKMELNYYFNDYKDYYYMKEEHGIMHKSVAIYADPAVRRKAKKQECFVAKEGTFIPIMKPERFPADMHIFRKDYASKQYFIELTGDMLANTGWLPAYYGQLV